MDTVCIGFVGRGLPVFPICLVDAFRCLPDAFPMLSDAFPMPYRCFPMLSRLLSNAFPMPSDARLECLPNTFPMPRRSLPHIIPFKSLPNSFAWIPSQLFVLSNTLLPQDKTSERHRKGIGKHSIGTYRNLKTAAFEGPAPPKHRKGVGKTSERVSIAQTKIAATLGRMAEPRKMRPWL